MAGFLAMGNDRYIGTYVAAQDTENGQFVEFDHVAKEGTLAEAGAQEVYFVSNENTNVKEHGIDDIDFVIKEGVYLRAHRPVAGEILVTTCFEGDLKEGDLAGIAGNGEVGTVEEGALFVVKEVTTEYSVPTLRLLVL